MDDSSDGNIFLLGGWVADASEWEKFSSRWAEILREEPQIAYFKHSEAKASRGQFEGWSPEQIHLKMTRLVDVICEYRMYGVIVGLKVDIHAKAFESSILSKKQLQSVLKLVYPYHYCFFALTACVMQIESESGNTSQRVDFVFDEQGELFKTCAEIYRDFKAAFIDGIKALAGTATEADDKKVVALQAADFLVGQMVSQFRLPEPESYFQKMVTCHEVHSATAYIPGFETIPDLVNRLNATWIAKGLGTPGQKKNPV